MAARALAMPLGVLGRRAVPLMLVGWLVVGAAAGCSDDGPCGVGDGCACSFDSDCPDRLVEFCDRSVFQCAARDEPLPDPDAANDSGDTADASGDVGPPPEELCEQPGDEDGDGASDCDDPDCRDAAPCAPVDYWVAYQNSSRGLPVVELLSTAGGAPVLVAGDGVTSLARDPAFGPDGRMLAVVYADAETTAIRLVNLFSGEVTSLDASGVGRLSGPAFSPDGSRIAYAGTIGDGDDTRSVVRMIDAAMGNLLEQWLSDSPTVGLISPGFLPDGSVVAIRTERDGEDFAGTQGDLVVVDFETGALERRSDDLQLSGRLRRADGGFVALSSALSRLVFLPDDQDNLVAGNVDFVAAAEDAACAPIAGRLAVCSRSFAAPGDPQISDLILSDWRTGDIVERLTDTPDVSEAGAVSHVGTADLERPALP